MIREAIEKVVGRIDLSENEMRAVFGEIMTGQAAPAQIGSLLTALRMKGETVDEITGAARVMREKAVKIHVEGSLVDTCGTGGSPINTFNISTTAALVAAGAGVRVAKHGNRSASSQCGSADVLESLGVRLDSPPEIAERCIREIGIGFLFAPVFHSAMKHAVGPRKEIGIRTIFNILGPLSNPAGASHQVLGVYDAGLTNIVARVLMNLGSKRAFVVHGMDGLDEITITGKTKIAELRDGKIKNYMITPGGFGLKTAAVEEIKGGSAQENADIVKYVLQGQKGAERDVVLLNAAAALIVGFKAKGFKDGIRLAAESIDSGAAFDKLNRMIEITGLK